MMVFHATSIPRLSTPVASPIRIPIRLFAHDEQIAAGEGSPITQAVLIVEDDFMIAMDLENALQDAGFNVTGVAASADEAVALVAAHKPSVVLMDIRLLGQRDGIDAALEIFRVHGIRSVFTSAHSDEDSRRRAEPAMPYGWIEKPYAVGTIVSFLKRLNGSD